MKEDEKLWKFHEHFHRTCCTACKSAGSIVVCIGLHSAQLRITPLIALIGMLPMSRNEIGRKRSAGGRDGDEPSYRLNGRRRTQDAVRRSLNAPQRGHSTRLLRQETGRFVTPRWRRLGRRRRRHLDAIEITCRHKCRHGSESSTLQRKRSEPARQRSTTTHRLHTRLAPQTTCSGSAADWLPDVTRLTTLSRDSPT